MMTASLSPAAAPAVLITGCSTGIGRACALDLAGRGWRVYAGVRRAEDGQRLHDEATGDLQPVLLDVTDAQAVESVAAQLDQALGAGGLRGLVNNAGIVVPGPLELLSTEQFRQQLEVNVLGTHAVTRAVLPLLRRAVGRTVIMGSISGRVAPPHYGAYAASKHALEALTDALRMELYPWRMPVSMIQPDNVDTPIWTKFDTAVASLEEHGDPDARRIYQQQMQRIRQSAARMQSTGMSTARVVAAVRHALSARRPRARYPVGLRTQLAIWGAAHLPTSWMDFFLRRAVSG